MNKATAVLALLAVSLCAGCNGNAAQTTTTAALSLIADDDTSEDEILLDDSEEFDVEYGDWDVEEFGLKKQQRRLRKRILEQVKVK
jgi:hypothetical protein